MNGPRAGGPDGPRPDGEAPPAGRPDADRDAAPPPPDAAPPLPDDEAPPGPFGSWGALYTVVIVWAVGLIVLLWLFTAFLNVEVAP